MFAGTTLPLRCHDAADDYAYYLLPDYAYFRYAAITLSSPFLLMPPP